MILNNILYLFLFERVTYKKKHKNDILKLLSIIIKEKVIVDMINNNYIYI